jgi:hypothetical protein
LLIYLNLKLGRNSEQTDKTVHLVVFVFHCNRAVIIRIPQACTGEVKARISLLENSTVADKFEASLLSMKCLDHFVGDSICPGLGLFLIICFGFKMLLDDPVADFIQLILDL